jgi:hypothetical protein
MPHDDPELKPLQHKAVAALLTHATVRDAAASVGVSERTLRRWKLEPAFVREFQRLRREMVDETTCRIQQMSMRAALTLFRNLDCGRPSAENRAALAILQMSNQGSENSELVRQVEELLAKARGEP